MNTRLISILVISLFVVGLGTYFLKGRQPKAPVDLEQQRRQLMRQKDLHVLGDHSAQTADVYAALVRLSQIKDSKARAEALARSGDPSPTVRMGAAQGLGYFTDPEAMSALEKLLKDTEHGVRMQAIQGLGHEPGEQRETLLNQVISSRTADREEVIAAWSSILVIAVQPQKRDAAIDSLLQLGLDPKTLEKDATVAILRVLSFAPRDPRTLAALRTTVEAGRNTGIVSVAIRHLASAQDALLHTMYGKLIQSSNIEVRLATVQGLRFSCDPKRFQHLDHLLRQEKDRRVSDAAIREVQLMPSAEGEHMLEKLVEDEVLTDELSRMARSAIVEIRRNSIDPCAVKPAVMPSPHA